MRICRIRLKNSPWEFTKGSSFHWVIPLYLLAQLYAASEKITAVRAGYRCARCESSDTGIICAAEFVKDKFLAKQNWPLHSLCIERSGRPPSDRGRHRLSSLDTWRRFFEFLIYQPSLAVQYAETLVTILWTILSTILWTFLLSVPVTECLNKTLRL